MNKLWVAFAVALVAASDAFAVNIVDDNPLYIPIEGRIYSISSIGSRTGSENIKSWTLNQEFGYGINNRWSVTVATDIIDQQSFDQWRWDNIAVETKFRALDIWSWKADLIAGYIVSNVWASHRPFLEKNPKIDQNTGFEVAGTGTSYTWAVGVRGGYTSSQFTIAGHLLLEYFNTGTFNWQEEEGEQGMHVAIFGVDGRIVLDNHFTLIGGAEYIGFVDNEWYGWPGASVENSGVWTGKLGLNYNIDTTKFVGGYMDVSLTHDYGENRDEWGFNKGVGFGAKFGIGF